MNVITLLFFTANGIVIVAIPPYLRDLGVVSETVIGTVISTAFLVSIVVRPVGGYVGDKIGYVWTMRLGLASAAAAQLAYLGGDVRWVQVGRVLHGFAIATFLPASIAASVVNGIKSMASRSLAVGIGNVAGPLVGSLAYDVGGARFAITVAFVLHSLNLLLALKTPTVEVAKSGGEGGRVERRVYLFMALLSIYSTTYMSLSTFIPVRLRDTNMPLAYWGLFSSIAAFVSLLPRVVLARGQTAASRTAGEAATAMAMVGLMCATLADGPLEFAAAGAIYGVGQGAVVVTYQIFALAGSRRAGLASAVYTMGWDVGSIVGPLTVGRLVEEYGYHVLYYIPLLLVVNLIALTRVKLWTSTKP